ncbi:transposase [Candidatus Saccharibacteria bacterium]|nr:transposase [Candidatus Saccharibacteria bacterium]
MEHDYKDNVKGQDAHSMYCWRVIRSYADFYRELLGIGTENPFVVGRKELDLAKRVMLGLRKWGYYNDRTLGDLAQTHHLIPRDIGTRLAGLSILDIGSGQGKLGQDLAQEYGVESYHLDLDLDTLQGGEEYGAQAVINGDREIVGFTLARSEDSDSWLTLLRDLQRRGIKGKNLELIVMDDSRGCKAAVDKVFGSVPLQNCIVHKLRQVLTKTHHKHKASMAEDLKLISNTNSVEEATRVAQDIAKKWYKKEERAITSLRHNFEYCLTYFQFPQDTWKQIRSTNLLEREFREVRRRTKVNDHSFNSFESQRRYHENIFQYLNQYYPSR